jgi:hypothetical protein
VDGDVQGRVAPAREYPGYQPVVARMLFLRLHFSGEKRVQKLLSMMKNGVNMMKT